MRSKFLPEDDPLPPAWVIFTIYMASALLVGLGGIALVLWLDLPAS